MNLGQCNTAAAATATANPTSPPTDHPTSPPTNHPTSPPTNRPTLDHPTNHPDIFGELPMCDAAGSERHLSAHVVHVSPSSGEVERAEVADALELALNGGEGFEALVETSTQHNQLLVLDKDQMQYDSGEVDNSDGSFTIENAFVHSDPNTMYRVACPTAAAAAEGEKCQITTMDINGGAQAGFECILDGERPVASDACLDSSYEVSLMAFPDSHFVLGAAGPGGDCPDVAFIGGSDGKSRMRYSPAATDVPFHVVGTASLRAILAAEELAPDPSDSPFDIATNTW